MKKPSSKTILKIIQRSLEYGIFKWSSQNSIVIYPSDEDIKYITVEFKVTLS